MGAAGILLTGGSSRRMGTAKAALSWNGRTLAEDIAERLLDAGLSPVIEAGPGYSHLPAHPDAHLGQGPLAALEGAWSSLAGDSLACGGHAGPAVCVACDLPFLGVSLLRWLACWPEDQTVVPVVHGAPQVLASRWASHCRERAASLLAKGQLSMRALLESDDEALLAGPELWGHLVGDAEFDDVDTPSGYEIASRSPRFT